MQALEAARCFEEGVLTDVREADVGSILGFGFAPFSGGTLSYIDMMGVKSFVELCQRLEKKYGARFAPAEAAARHGEERRKFLPPLRARQEGGMTMQYSSARPCRVRRDRRRRLSLRAAHVAGAIVGAGLRRDRRGARSQPTPTGRPTSAAIR